MTQTLDISYSFWWLPSAKISLLTAASQLHKTFALWKLFMKCSKKCRMEFIFLATYLKWKKQIPPGLNSNGKNSFGWWNKNRGPGKPGPFFLLAKFLKHKGFNNTELQLLLNLSAKVTPWKYHGAKCPSPGIRVPSGSFRFRCAQSDQNTCSRIFTLGWYCGKFSINLAVRP